MPPHRPIQLLDLIKQEELEKVLRVFTNATGVASIITDVEGRPLTRPQNFTPFCLHYCRSTVSGQRRCHESDRLGGMESARTRKPYIYPCLNAGLIDFAAPVIVQGHHLATILGGQVLEKPVEAQAAMEGARAIGIEDVDGYLEALGDVPFMSRQKLLAVVDLMSVITQTVSELALQKHLVQRNSQQYLHRVINSVSDCIISTNSEDIITMVNRSGAAMFGHRVDELLGQSIDTLFADSRSKREVENNLQNSRETKWRGELAARTLRGQSIPVQVSFSKILENNHHHAGYVGVIRDITEEKKMARMKEDLIGMLTHDMRNPILSVQKALDLMVNGTLGPLNENQAQIMELALVTSNQLFGMVSDLLDIYREENGSFLLHRSQIDLQQVVLDSLRQLDLFAKEKNIRFHHRLEDPERLLEADKNRLFRVCINLFDNAIKYSPEGSTIEVSTRMTGLENQVPGANGDASRSATLEQPRQAFFSLRIDDRGPGIPKKYHGRIFDKFFTLQTKRSDRKEGIGLGLVFCKQVVEAHGGRIWVESPVHNGHGRKPYGSSFQFIIPVTPQPDISDKRIATRQPDAQPVPESLRA